MKDVGNVVQGGVGDRITIWKYIYLYSISREIERIRRVSHFCGLQVDEDMVIVVNGMRISV